MKIRKIYNKALAAFLAFSMVFSMSAITYASDNGEFTIKIVHTNDIHARVQENERSGIIGAERLGGIIDSFTEGADMDLVLDSGDLFHGQPIATLTEGESIARLVKECGYDAMTAGNHDWSYGKDRLKELCGIAGLTMITGNVVETETENRFFDEEFYIEDVTVDGKELKVGIFGVIDPKIKKSTSPSNVEGLEFTDTAEYANEAARQLKEQDCDIVIALAHTYAPCELAEKVSGVDLWLVGHEHIQINEEVTDAAGKSVQVVESGYYLYSMSLIEISGTLDDDGNAENISISVNQIAYDEAKEAPKKEQVSTVLSEINAEQEQKLSEKVGTTPVTLNGIWEDLRIDQQNLGNVVADAYLLETGADVAFENAGGIRASIEAGDVTYGDIIGVSPYGNYIVTKEVTGAELKEIMETSLDIQLQCIEANNSGEYDAWPQSSGSYLQFGGMTVTFNPNAEKGNRILAIYIRDAFLNQEYMPDAEEYYTVATNNYVAVSSYYPQLADKEETGQFSSCDEALVRFFEQDEDKIAGSINSVRLFRRTPGAEWTSGGDGTKINPYLIPDALALKELSVNVNAGNDYSGAYFKMTEDIDLSSVCGENIDGEAVSWTPIGISTLDEDDKPFSGIFNGDGHKITGMYIDTANDFQGLFGYADGGEIKNLTVSGTVTGKNFVAGIVGWSGENEVIENCVNECEIVGSEHENTEMDIVGGIAGVNEGVISKCYNKCDIKTVDSNNVSDDVGGIAGANDGTIENCYNLGDISGRIAVGGIAGLNNLIIRNCYNTGSVDSEMSAGGISAKNGYLGEGTMENCYNTGAVSGGEKAGGITALNTAAMKNCYNVGSVSSEGGSSGGVTADNRSTVHGCYYLEGTADGGIGDENQDGAAEALTAEEFASQTSFENWDFESTWIINAYLKRPVLRGLLEDMKFEGAGTEDSPYLIPDIETLVMLKDSINEGNSYKDKYFKLTEDIDLSSVCGENIDGNEVSWERIGTSKTPFSAVFDGNGHKISGLYINEPTGNYRALFGYVKNGVIKNLTVSGEVSGSNFTGGIVGWLYSGSTIENCISNVSVTGAMGTYHTLEKAGGIVGYNCGNVIGCQNKGYVKTADYEDSKSAVGGIAGLNGIDGVIKNCINSGQIYGYANAGGIVGDTFNSDTVISCINVGLISSKSSSGGIIGTPGKTSKDCYYLKGTADGGTDDGAQEKTAAEFADGSVAYLLQSVQTGGSMVWGQTLDAESADSYPVLTNNNEKTVYKVTFVSKNAEYSASYANPNKTVTLPDAPKVSGYTFVKWAKKNVSDGEKFTAETPVTENVTVYAITKKRHSGGGSSVSIKPTQPQNTEQPSTTPTVDDKPSNIKVFADVSEDAWYYNSVKYVSENGLMYGVNETDFAPDMSITRAMFVTILYRMENEPDMSNEILGCPFGDVDSESWYTDAVYWACKNGIVNGISNEKFAPNDSITREQMAVILYRYAVYKGLNTNISGKLQYNDNTDISDYAKDAVIWNMDNGIMFGNDDNTFAPLSNTTRAQAAAVFVRMTELDR